MRRLVIAHDDSGKSVVASDGPIPEQPIPGLGMIFRTWSANEPALYPDKGADPAAEGLFPPLGGVRMLFCEYEPGKRVESVGDGDISGVPWEENGMHKTDTTDISHVLDGEIVLGIDDNVEITLHKGDTTVMSGARHYWRNASDKPATLVFFMVGARRAEE